MRHPSESNWKISVLAVTVTAGGICLLVSYLRYFFTDDNMLYTPTALSSNSLVGYTDWGPWLN